jgi:hypothetical protein
VCVSHFLGYVFPCVSALHSCNMIIVPKFGYVYSWLYIDIYIYIIFKYIDIQWCLVWTRQQQYTCEDYLFVYIYIYILLWLVFCHYCFSIIYLYRAYIYMWLYICLCGMIIIKYDDNIYIVKDMIKYRYDCCPLNKNYITHSRLWGAAMDGRDNSTEAWGPGAPRGNCMAVLPQRNGKIR